MVAAPAASCSGAQSAWRVRRPKVFRCSVSAPVRRSCAGLLPGDLMPDRRLAGRRIARALPQKMPLRLNQPARAARPGHTRCAEAVGTNPAVRGLAC
jgi:hypothetical protein